MQDTAKFWDKTAPKYAKSPIADEEAYTYTLERTRTYLSSEDSVLEVACGTGSTALLLAGSVRQIVASDISGAMIGIGEQKARDQGVSNVKFVKAELSDNSVESDPYDAVLAFNILHLLEDLPAAIGRVNRLLKPGGLFISKTICEPESGMPFKYKMIKTVLPLMQWVGMAPFVKFMSIRELEGTITSAGFKIIETGNYPASPPSRYIVARKS